MKMRIFGLSARGSLGLTALMLAWLGSAPRASAAGGRLQAVDREVRRLLIEGVEPARAWALRQSDGAARQLGEALSLARSGVAGRRQAVQMLERLRTSRIGGSDAALVDERRGDILAEASSFAQA